MAKLKKSVFDTLSSINVNDKTEKKGNLTYLSWAWAWTEVKKHFPDVKRTVYEQPNGLNYWTDDVSGWVKVGVTINEIEHIDYLPIMDFRNNSIACEKITSTDVNKAIQRSMTKALALHGLGIYIYAGEDLPEGHVAEKPKKPKLDAKRLEGALLSIQEGTFSEAKLRSMFELNVYQEARVKKFMGDLKSVKESLVEIERGK